MAKLFLKLWALVLLTSLTSFQIQRHVFEWSMDEAAVSNSNERFRRTYVMIEEVLAPFPKSEWPARFEKLKARVGSPEVFLGPSQLLTLEDLAKRQEFSPEALQVIQSQNPYSRELPNGFGYEIFHTILGTNFVVVLKAPFAKSKPMFILGIFTPTQFTWLVESSMYALAILLWLRLFRRDMLTLEKAANRVGEGHFDFEITMGKGAALYTLADSFNKMKHRIGALLNSHRNLTNAVSHEFRTPITRLRFRHELAEEAKSPAEKDEQLRAMSSAIDQLDDLSTELLEYARLDRETPVLDVGPIDTVAWLGELVEEARDLATAEGRLVDIQVAVDAESADGDYRYLSRAAANLLKNAVRHANGQVRLHFVSTGGKQCLHVDDDGPGIPAAEREHLFEPFTRVDKSRDRQSGGFGMGLAIVKQIARWHGGSVAITESSLGGARVSLSW
ncbi:MAG: ATP-binding protein [Betaproteobacteria bacterium]